MQRQHGASTSAVARLNVFRRVPKAIAEEVACIDELLFITPDKLSMSTHVTCKLCDVRVGCNPSINPRVPKQQLARHFGKSGKHASLLICTKGWASIRDGNRIRKHKSNAARFEQQFAEGHRTADRCDAKPMLAMLDKGPNYEELATSPASYSASCSNKLATDCSRRRGRSLILDDIFSRVVASCQRSKKCRLSTFTCK